MTFSLDFNHGALKDVNDPRARDISEPINADIDAVLFRPRSEEEKREYVGASAIGNECLRAVQFNYAGVEPDEGRITGRRLRIFDTGHHFEDIKSRQEGSLAPEASRSVSMARRIAGRSARPAASFQQDQRRWGGRPSHDGTVRIADLGAVL